MIRAVEISEQITFAPFERTQFFQCEDSTPIEQIATCSYASGKSGLNHFVFPSAHVGAGGDNFDANITSTEPWKAVGTLKTAWHTAKKLGGVEVRWHDLRHTAVTRLLENGQTLPMVASIMGWSPSTTVRMAQRYGHISTDARRVAMEAMNGPRRGLTPPGERIEAQSGVHDESVH